MFIHLWVAIDVVGKGLTHRNRMDMHGSVLVGIESTKSN